MNPENLPMAFLLTILAGLSTGIGSLIALFIRNRNNTRYLSIAMGFAAGVMLYVSFTEILPEAVGDLEKIYEEEGSHLFGSFLGTLAFFGGMLLVALIDKIIPQADNPHELLLAKHAHEESEIRRPHLMRVGILTAFALALHNFPEGVATFITTLDDVKMGIVIAVAIALHNIPEGVAVSMPIYYATGSRKKAFMYSFLSGIVEPLGAFMAYLFLMPYLTPVFMALLLAGVAGMMVFIALDQLLPAAEEYGEHHLTIYGVVAGMAVMAMSMLLLHGHHEH
jgi:ZIP family zinc transporter